jgi:NADH:ubiquinone oxidoreductase subunit E
MTRIELCLDHLSPATRETLLEVIYTELRISPGEITADGNFELELTNHDPDAADPENAPYVRINGLLFARVTESRMRELINGRKRH